MQQIETTSGARNQVTVAAGEPALSGAEAANSAHAPSPLAKRGCMRAVAVAAVAALLGLGAAGAAHAQCTTGELELTAISEEEYEQLASEAGDGACVTPEVSGVTVCQIVPVFSETGTWTVVAQAPEGGSDAQSAAEVTVQSGFSCFFHAVTPLESTDSPWVKAIATFLVAAEPPPLDFIAVVQVGGGNQVTATICPLGDGNPGDECYQWLPPRAR